VLDEPVVITHGLDGQLRAFYNVCRHRAGQVALTKGNRKSLQCRYHGWTYGLDGCLRAAPEMEATEGFAKEDFGLVPVRVEQWGPFVFVNLSADAPPLMEVMGAIPAEVARAGYDVERMRLVERRDYVIECNWKVYVDNYLEGYHVPYVHPELAKLYDYQSYTTTTYPWYSLQHAPITGDNLYARGGGGEAFYYWVWPNLMLNILPGRLQTNLILPLGHDRCRVIFRYFYDEASLAEPGRIEEDVRYSDGVQAEDAGICARVQQGLASRAYDRGRFSVKYEEGVWHFHSLLRRAYQGAHPHEDPRD
jgi:choline monooxygenase